MEGLSRVGTFRSEVRFCPPRSAESPRSLAGPGRLAGGFLLQTFPRQRTTADRAEAEGAEAMGVQRVPADQNRSARSHSEVCKGLGRREDRELDWGGGPGWAPVGGSGGSVFKEEQEGKFHQTETKPDLQSR